MRLGLQARCLEVTRAEESLEKSLSVVVPTRNLLARALLVGT